MNQMDIFYPDQSFYPTALDTIDPPSGSQYCIGVSLCYITYW